MFQSETFARLRAPILAFASLLVLYLWLVKGMGPTLSIAVFIILGVVYLIWPNDAMLLVTPALLPTVDLDLGLGRSPFPIIAAAALAGQWRRGQWSVSAPRWIYRTPIEGQPLGRSPRVGITIGLLPTILLKGWLLLILSLFLSTVLNERDLYPGLFVWMVRCALMLTYISAWQHGSYAEYGFWGWVVAGLLITPAVAIVYNATGSVLAIREGLAIMGQGDTLAVMYLLLSASGFLVVSFWSVWALCSIRVLPSILAYSLSVVFAISLLFSGRRQALLAILLSLGTFVFTVPLRQSRRMLVVLAVSLCLVIYSGLLAEFVEGRESIRDEFEGRGTGRLSLYSVGVDAFLERPVRGWGLGSYRDLTYSAGLINRQTGEGGASHNTFVGVAVEAGVLGVLGVLLVVVGATKPTLALARMTHQIGPGPWAYTYPILGFVVAGALVSRLIEDNWYLLSLAMLCGAGGRLTGDSNPIEGGGERVPSGVRSVCTQDRALVMPAGSDQIG